MATLIFSLLGTAGPAQAWTVLCTGFAGCTSSGYSNYGYSAVYTKSFWSQSAGHNCTNYVAYRKIKDGMSSTWPGGSTWGYARDWGTLYSSKTNSTPAVGSVAWWGTEFSSTGHVAYVEKVISSTEILVSEDNWGGDFRWRRVVRGSDKWPLGFVHFTDKPTVPSTDPQPAPSNVGYQPITPTRLVDTRVGTGAPTGRVPAGSEIAVTVSGRAGLPATGMSAVVLNVTAVSPLGAGFLTAYPSGASRPTASNVNYVAGQTVANQVVAGVGSDGRVKIFASNSAHVVVDVAGYYAGPGKFTALVPGRVLDTRIGLGAERVRIPARGQVDVQVTGVKGVPASGAAAVALNVTAVDPSGAGFVTAWPAGSPRPDASSLNYVTGSIVAGMVIAKVGTGGQVSLMSSASSDLVVDVSGWFPAASDYTGTTPARLLDTRSGLGGPAGSLPAGRTVTLDVTGRGGVPASGVEAVMLTVTAVDPGRDGYMVAFPSGTSRPVASTVNYPASRTVANSTLVKVGADGTVRIYTHAPADLVVDVQGYVTE
ncbi:MAG: CHAP domain-containing protein [Dermatophilaceae bacterium]